MRTRINTRTAVVVAALGLIAIPTASAGQARLADWCPQSSEPCQKAGGGTRAEPSPFRPMIIPFRGKDRNGNEVWRSGSWIMY